MSAPHEAHLEAASWLRRIGALLIDWIASTLVTVVLVGNRYLEDPALNWLPLAVFWLESSVGVAIAGGSFGQLALKVRVIGDDGRPVSLLRALARQLLVCLVIPPLVFRPDGRGLHDMWTRSGAYRIASRPAG